MASSCGSSYASSLETTNFARICRIVVDVLRDILWQVLIHEIPPADLPNKVQINQNKLGKLDVKIKTWLCGITPSSPAIPIAEKFDVSSLYTLIRNLCSQVPTPSTQWGKTPPPGGTKLGDDIERVRKFRNTLYGHATLAKIDTADFNKLCIDIKNVVSRFDVYFSSNAMKCDFNSEIDTIITCSMDRKLEDDYIDKMKEIAVLSDDLGDIKQQVLDVKEQVKDVMQEVGDIKQQVGDVKEQVGNVMQEVGDVKQQVGDVKEQVGDVRQQVDDVKGQVSSVNHQVGNVNQNVGDVKEQVGNVMQEVCDVKQQVGDVKQEIGNVNQQVGEVMQQVVNVIQEFGDVKQQVGNVMQEVGDVKQQVDDVKQQVGNVMQKVGDVNQQVGNVKQEIGNVNQQVCEVTQQVVSVMQEVGDVKQQVGEVMQQVVNVMQEFGDVKQQVGDVRQQVGNVMQEVGDVKQQVDDVKEQIGNVNQQVGDVKQHIGSVMEEVCDVKQQVGDVKQEIGNVNQQVGEVMQQVVNVIQEFGDVKQQVGDVRQQVGNVMQEVGDVNQQVDDVKEQIGNVNQQVGDVKQHIGNVMEEVCDVKQHIGNVMEEVCDVKQQVGDVRQQVVSVMQEVGDVKQQFGDVKEQVGDVKQQVDDVKQHIGNVMEEVCDVKQEIGNVNQQVGEVMQQVGNVMQEVGNVKQQFGDVMQRLEFHQYEVQKGCMEGAKQEDIEDLRNHWRKTDADIAEIKETLKKKPDVVEKVKIDDLQTEEFRLVSDGSNQPISLDKNPSQSLQAGEQTPSVKMEASLVVEGKNDPEADKQEPVIPEEILRMDERSIQMFKEALRDRTVKVYNVRVMVVGQYGVGKTTLTKRLLGDNVNISERKSTEGIDVHIHRCKVSLATGEWLKHNKDAEQADRAQLYCKLLNNQGQEFDIGDEQAGYSKPMHQMETDLDVEEIYVRREESTNLGKDQKRVKSSSSKGSDSSYEDQSSEEDNKSLKTSSKVISGDKENSFSNISKEDLSQKLEESVRNADMSDNEDTVKNILQFLNENADKLVRSREEYSPLAMWDFAGQYVYYTTHQTFLTQRAIYLLVIDLSQHATDIVKDDDCFFDIEGKKECQVHDLVELWLNSIHSCAPSLESGSPPVILVGTHLDKIEQDIPQERSENVFWQIRFHYLRGRPARLHLANEDFSIDNTIEDPKIKDLQKKIVELASQQPHWGESIPGRWLPLQERLMSLKARGVKVIPYHFLEKMNQEGDVKIESKDELDLFLKFQHDIGNILYFSTEELKQWIVLEPQWLIKAMKSLITAEMFILRNHPGVENEWHQFKEEGKLTQELLDIIWSKEHDPDLHDHKALILLLMEQLNIIARPMLFTEDGDKAEDFFLAPCMLCERAPLEVISPKAKPEMASSSVLCFVFTGRFLPSPIFHRLVAVCVAKWPILKKRGTNQIFCGCCVFEINHLYRLTLYFKSYVIFARVTLAAAKRHSLDAEVCIPVREFINYNLSKILGNLSQNLKFELFMQCQCPQSVGDCLDSMFSVKELNSVAEMTCRYHDDCNVESHSLLKHWFQNKEHYSEDIYTKLSERQLGRISMRTWHKSALLGLELGLSKADIENIQKDYPHAVTQCLMILFKWKLESGDEATFGNLEMALRRADIDVGTHKSVNTAGKEVSCLPVNIQDKQPEDKHLKQICSRIGTEHVLLGVELEVPLSRIDQILTEHQGNVQRQCFEIMKDWRRRLASHATFRNLEKAFRCIGINPDILKQSMN